jgi:DNA repair protein RadC
LIPRKPISQWPLSERPREKLLQQGAQALSNAELLAIILRIGTRGSSAVELGRTVMQYFGGFRQMADADLAEWRKIKGLGTAKTASLIAAVEIGRRFWAEETVPSKPIETAEQVAAMFSPHLRDLKHEVFDLLLLNGKRKPLCTIRMDEGTITETNTYSRDIMTAALQKRAAGIVLIHNHPSGESEPSASDKDLTRQVVYAGRIMNVRVHDHVIIGDNKHFSFEAEGLIAGFENEWAQTQRKDRSHGQESSC